MLYITIPETELFDEVNEKFIKIKEQKLCLEHSLISLSKWESRNRIRFIDNSDITEEQMLDYIYCMIVTPVNYDKQNLLGLTKENINEIKDYITNSKTATTLPDNKGNGRSGPKENITSELIYYWMIACGIPFECEKWHLDRLITLIRICQIKNEPSKNLSKYDALSRTKNLNAARRAAKRSH